MRSSKSRSRNKNNRQRTLGNILNRVFDSSGPEGKVRGTPQQIIEKYLTLARDAQLSNDRVAEQSFFQHAEHYTRMLGEAQREMAERQQQFQHQNQNNRQNGDEDGENGGRESTPRDQDNGQRYQDRDANASDQSDARRGGHDAPQPDIGDQPGEAEQPQAVPNQRSGNNQLGGNRRQGRGRSYSQDSGNETATSVSSPAPAPEQTGLGLPDAVGASDDGGPVETPETTRVRKPRAKSTTTTRSPRTTTRKKAKPDGGETGEAPVTQSSDGDNG